MKAGTFPVWPGAIFLGVAVSTVALAQNDDAICAAPLSAALKSIKTSTSGSKSATAESTWQCSFKFSTHDQAINAGLDVDAVVFGVPLKVGGKFDQKQVSSWKDENCSQSAKSADFQAATFTYLEEAAPGSMRAFSDCIVAKRSPRSLVCEASRSPLSVAVKWRRNDEDKVNPKIKQAIVSGGSCRFGFVKGEKVLEGGIGGPCAADPKRDFAVYFQTDRGICIASVPYDKRPFVVGGKVVLSDARAIEADVVTFAEGAEVVTNGHVFSIVADEINISGNARIKSFDGLRAGRPPGDPGRSGGTTILQAKEVSGGRLEVSLPGEPGVDGQAGGKGPTGSSGNPGAGNAWVWLKGCVGGRNGDPGGVGLRGGNGGNGGKGGDGGTAVISIDQGLKNGAALRIEVLPALPGAFGGPGGPGEGEGGKGGAGGTGSGTCGGSDEGAKGPQGPAGDPGAPGQPGVPGSAQFVKK